MRNVISTILVLMLLCGVAGTVHGQNSLQKKVDSLFVLASSGEVKFQHLVEPAIDSIAALGAPAVPILVDKLDTKSARERLTIINILKKIGSPAVPYLVTALSFEDGLVVERVAWSLGDIKDTTATLGLLSVVHHNRWQVREQAIGALGEIEDHRADHAVATALGDSISLVRKAAAVSAGQLRLNNATRMLAHLLGDQFYGARLMAAESLEKLDTAQVVQVLIDSLESENRLVGNVGVMVLGKLGTEAAIQALLQQANSAEPERRAHAAIALIQADPQDTREFRALYLQNEPDRLTRLKVESMISSVADGNTKQSQ